MSLLYNNFEINKMTCINTLIESLIGHIKHVKTYNTHSHVKVFLASQNIDIFSKAILYKLSVMFNNVDLNIEEMSSNEIQQKLLKIIQDIYFGYGIHLEYYPKPYPNPGGDFIGIDTNGSTRIYWDLDLCIEGQAALDSYLK